MPDSTINGLSALTGASVDNTADQIPIWDNSAATTKKISRSEFSKNLPQSWFGSLGVSNSVDAVAIVSRSVDGSISTNGHAFSDSSDVNRPGGVAYNSFDARITFSGSSNYDHYAAFQSGPLFNTSGTINDYFSFVDAPTITSGTISNHYSLHAIRPSVSGSGSITNQYVIFIPSNYAVASGSCYAFYNASSAKFWNASSVGGVSVVGSDSERVADSGVQVQDYTSNGTAAKIRVRQTSQNYWDFTIPASSTALTIADVGGEKLRIDENGNIATGGVIPSSWADIKAIEIGSKGNAISGYTGDAGTYLTSNAFYGFGGWKYGLNNRLATLYKMEGGLHAWFTAANSGGSGAGTSATFSERFRIKNEGQVRFYPLASAPASAEKGDVYYDSTTDKLRCYNGTTWNDLF